MFDVATAYALVGLLYLLLPVVGWIVLSSQQSVAANLWTVGSLMFGAALLLLAMRLLRLPLRRPRGSRKQSSSSTMTMSGRSAAAGSDVRRGRSQWCRVGSLITCPPFALRRRRRPRPGDVGPAGTGLLPVAVRRHGHGRVLGSGTR